MEKQAAHYLRWRKCSLTLNAAKFQNECGTRSLDLAIRGSLMTYGRPEPKRAKVNSRELKTNGK